MSHQHYIDDCIIELGPVRVKHFKISKKSGNGDDWVLAKRQRLLVNYAVRKANIAYHRNKLKECKGDTRKFWSQVKGPIPSSDTRKITEIIDKKDGSLLKGTEACNFFFLFFFFVPEIEISFSIS